MAYTNKVIEILKNYENNGPGWDFGERDASLVSS